MKNIPIQLLYEFNLKIISRKLHMLIMKKKIEIKNLIFDNLIMRSFFFGYITSKKSIDHFKLIINKFSKVT